MKLKVKLTNLIVTAAVLAVPAMGICQGPPPPNEGGGNPEVPFDTMMNFIFLTAGVLFAAFIAVNQYRKKVANNKL